MNGLDTTLMALICANAASTTALNIVLWLYGRLEKDPSDYFAMHTIIKLHFPGPSTILATPTAALLFIGANGWLSVLTAIAIASVSAIKGTWWYGPIFLGIQFGTMMLTTLVMRNGGAEMRLAHLFSWLAAPLSLAYIWYYAFSVFGAAS